MTRFAQPLLATLLAVVPAVAHAQAVTPVDHPGFVLAEAIAAQGCVLHQDDVNDVLEVAGLVSPQFPQMAVPLMQDGYLMPTGEGTLTLVNWGLCLAVAETAAQEVDAEAADAEEVDIEEMPTEEAPTEDAPVEETPAQPDKETTPVETE